MSVPENLSGAAKDETGTIPNPAQGFASLIAREWEWEKQTTPYSGLQKGCAFPKTAPLAISRQRSAETKS